MPDHGRPAGTVSQSGYPQAMWTTAPMLWRTPAKPVHDPVDRPVDKHSDSLPTHRSDLRISRPPAVQKKNFPGRFKIDDKRHEAAHLTQIRQ